MHLVQRLSSKRVRQKFAHGTGWSVGRSVDARGPVDHASVGVAQARPN